MEARAIARNIRIAPRKARIVIDLIRGKSVAEAANILRFTPKVASEVIMKVMNSAAANAENNLQLDINKLYVKEAFVDSGSTLKRWHPRAQGRMYQILKRSCHITVVVKER
ncbi:MAG: 50S ribosomal protein L22 [Firmicutes bacterium]|nr:50S ribosomal protein L22 [Dethiobacter sp.]MBS3888256.1 50S ribosomal protein L22 [Bacillota bacterium]MBS4053650.1 50S ribosomal protein L22 [Thermaerobacter sp.]